MTNLISEWFNERNLDTVIVGFSGGIDSSVTAALLWEADINVVLVVAEAENQTYSSPYGGIIGARKFAEHFTNKKQIQIKLVSYPHLFNDDAANEAALPIIRNAIFYGVCAEYREKGSNCIVVGTANFDEAAYLGFWGKASDAAQDFYPISHLHKSQVYAEANRLNIPKEIINATPAGDIQFKQTNDFKMIGAAYPQIEKIAHIAEKGWRQRSITGAINQIIGDISLVHDPKLFCDNVIRNSFKYDLPFPNFHLDNRLEEFRNHGYNYILHACKEYMEDNYDA